MHRRRLVPPSLLTFGLLLGCGAEQAPAEPTPVAIAAGGASSCALLDDSTVKCWGSNTQGQLGNGTLESTRTPTLVEGLEGVAQLAVGADFACALLDGGDVVCWGSNSRGQLGDGTDERALTPPSEPVVTGATDVAVSTAHACAVLASGSGQSWGANSRGQLGDGTTTESNTPVLVAGIDDAIQVVVGILHTCVLRQSGGVSCWGSNEFGELGVSMFSDGETVFMPRSVMGLNGVEQIAGFARHTCARTSRGGVSCWGLNLRGQIGDGTVTDALTPRPLSAGGGWADVAVGGNHSCGVSSIGGSVSCWGANRFGQLGSSTNEDALSPDNVSSINNITHISLGEAHTCALEDQGTVWCWGDNRDGQLGPRSQNEEFAPIEVTGL
ncbi:MAG: hypothetical protein AAGI01_12440 [Myxococcota bacterium]